MVLCFGNKVMEVYLKEEAYYMIATNDNGLAIIGVSTENSDEVTGYHGGQYDYWVVKLNPDSITGIKEMNNPDNRDVVSVYPNPASSFITINNLPPDLIGTINDLRITDVLGNEVYHQASRLNRDNQQSMVINISQWSNGVYFYQLTNNKETFRGKFVKE